MQPVRNSIFFYTHNRACNVYPGKLAQLAFGREVINFGIMLGASLDYFVANALVRVGRQNHTPQGAFSARLQHLPCPDKHRRIVDKLFDVRVSHFTLYLIIMLIVI
jgi:hypothetical protein